MCDTLEKSRKRVYKIKIFNDIIGTKWICKRKEIEKLMGNIVLLDDLTINKIAAGEVIERPASVVKELVENSIDAGATNVSVEIRNGGISYIRITDNGKGILPEDMEIAFERHATSKIRKAEDLTTVKSMGFRGEALASVASIAKVEMVSRAIGQEIGYKIELEGGNVLNKEEAGCPQGTSITVTDLFFNTPVRYKFLKKDFTESGYIEDVITRIALVNPNIAIKLVNSGKTVIQTSGNGDIKGVIYSIYGKDIAENVIPVNFEYEDLKITGVVGKPVIARSNRSNQIFFVNHRYIKDKTLTAAAEKGYKGMITIGKFGFLILNIDMPANEVDVNVHPAKLEVRFEDEGKIYRAVYHAINNALLAEDLVADREKEASKGEEKEITASTSSSMGLFRKTKNETLEEGQTGNTGNILEDVFRAKQQRELEATRPIATQQEPKVESEKVGQPSDAFLNQALNQIKQMQEALQQGKNLSPYTQPSGNSEGTEMKTQVLEAEEEKKEEDLGETKVLSLKELNEAVKKQDEEIDASLKQAEEIEQKKMQEEMAPKTEVAEEINFDEMYAKTFGKTIQKPEEVAEEKEEYVIKPEELATAQTYQKEDNVSVFEGREEYQRPVYKFIGIAFSTYIIIEMDKELYIIDQHAAHERIMYERVKKNYYQDQGQKESQLMLLPDIITLTNKEMGIARDNWAMFEKAGFMLEEFGENTIKLSGVPNICLDLDTKELFLETLDEINTVARTAKQEIEEKFIATVACKAAVKANMALDKEEVDQLMDQLLRLPNPFTCPHGRPTAIKMTKTDIEKKFSRR